MERFIGLMMVPFIPTPVCIGPNQFAYQPHRGARDALAFMAFTWIIRFNDKKKYSISCSDVSGAFDRVSRKPLIDKLIAKGLCKELMNIVSAWLDKAKQSWSSESQVPKNLISKT